MLARESKGLLIGEGADRQIVESLKLLISEQPEILRVNELLTMHFGPKDILLNLSVDFDDRFSSAEAENAITRMEADIKARYPEITRVFIEAQSWRGHLDSQRPTAEADAVETQPKT